MGPYWASLPAQGTVHTKETFSRDSLDLLQDGSMVHCLLTPGNLACASPSTDARIVKKDDRGDPCLCIPFF